MESTYPAGLCVPTHVHAAEDEMFYLIAGELTGYCDEDSWTAPAGSFVFVPRGHPHSFKVTGTRPATALVITGPSQLDRQIATRGEDAPDTDQ